jgi:hypothetical protein
MMRFVPEMRLALCGTQAKWCGLIEPRGSPNATQHMALKHQNETANELALKYGSISVRTLREFYGSFAPHCADGEKLSEVLADLDGASLTQLLQDYKTGRLKKICQTGQIHVVET